MTRRGWLLFAAMCVLWGVPYFFIRIAVSELSPLLVVSLRTGLAALLLLPVAARRGVLGALRGRLRLVVVFALAEVAVPFSLIAVGEQHVSSSLTGLLLAAVPMAVAVLALRVDPEERADRARLAGLLVGLAGVCALLGLDVGATGLGSALAILGAAVSYAVGALLIKRTLADVPPLAMVSAGLLLTTLLLAPIAAWRLPPAWPRGTVLASIVVLALACTAVAMLCFFALVGEAGPARATVITYVNPLVALVLGVAFLHERVRPSTVFGLFLVLAGSWLSTRRSPEVGGPPPGLAAVQRQG